jgi:hypothetical protein
MENTKIILTNLKAKYETLNNEYLEECARDYMSRRATYLDGQLAILYTLIQEVEDMLYAEEEQGDLPYDPSDFDFEDDVDETNYDPYAGCDCYDN